MLPNRLSPDFVRDILLHAKASGDFAGGLTRKEYFRRLCGGQFGAGVSNALRVIAPATSLSVEGVVGLCTKAQMVGIHACGRVTSMKDAHAVGDGAVRRLPRNAMSEVVVALHAKDRVTQIRVWRPTQMATRHRFGDRVMRQPLRKRPRLRAVEFLCQNSLHGGHSHHSAAIILCNH